MKRQWSVNLDADINAVVNVIKRLDINAVGTCCDVYGRHSSGDSSGTPAAIPAVLQRRTKQQTGSFRVTFQIKTQQQT